MGIFSDINTNESLLVSEMGNDKYRKGSLQLSGVAKESNELWGEFNRDWRADSTGFSRKSVVTVKGGRA